MKKLLIIFSFLLLIFSPLTASAQWGKAKGNLDTVAKPTQLSGNFETSVSTIIKGALSLLGTIFLILMVYAGILWMTAQGNDDKVSKAKDIIQAAIIGLVVVMSAYAITSFITSKVGGTSTDSGSGTGNAGEPSGFYCLTKSKSCEPIETAICDDSGNGTNNFTNSSCQ